MQSAREVGRRHRPLCIVGIGKVGRCDRLGGVGEQLVLGHHYTVGGEDLEAIARWEVGAMYGERYGCGTTLEVGKSLAKDKSTLILVLGSEKYDWIRSRGGSLARAGYPTRESRGCRRSRAGNPTLCRSLIHVNAITPWKLGAAYRKRSGKGSIPDAGNKLSRDKSNFTSVLGSKRHDWMNGVRIGEAKVPGPYSEGGATSSGVERGDGVRVVGRWSKEKGITDVGETGEGVCGREWRGKSKNVRGRKGDNGDEDGI